MRYLGVLLGFVGGVLGSSLVSASDHIDGKVTTSHRVGDLTDLYAFPTPTKPGSLTLVLNSYPLVTTDGHFSAKVFNRFILREANLVGAGSPSFGIKTDPELIITCHFITPQNHDQHTVKCDSSTGLTAQKTFNDNSTPTGSEPMSVYAGRRSDPFFLNVKNFNLASKDGRMGAPDPKNDMDQMNVLSLVIEVNVLKLFGYDPHSIAVAAEAFTLDYPGAPERRLDRMGRPEITNFSLVAHDGDQELRDHYNLDRPFEVAEPRRLAYEARLQKNLKFYDGIDKKQDWDDSQIKTLATVLSNDFLLIDIKSPCDEDSFLSIERSLMAKQVPHSCGGRKLTDDIMDTLMTTYIGGLKGPRIRDGVDRPYKELSKRFPYLVSPDDSLSARIRRTAAVILLGIPNVHLFN